jgi:hypothetical protein
MMKQLNDSFYFTASAHAGFVQSPTPLKVNDTFYLPNFKGISNIGYHYDSASKKKGLGGDILGFDRYCAI